MQIDVPIYGPLHHGDKHSLIQCQDRSRDNDTLFADPDAVNVRRTSSLGLTRAAGLKDMITKRQHYVPKFYLAQWATAATQITCHDLTKDTTFACNPADALVQSYFYEEDLAAPDNRIENILATMENIAAPIFQKITSIIAKDGDATKHAKALQSELKDDDIDGLSGFAAYQYLRVPGAIDQKGYELQTGGMTEAELVHALNPGRFVESGYSYIRDQFRAMKMLIMVSPGREFITSDWPCFDMKDSRDSPLLGEEIGKRPNVVCYMPLAPLLGAVFYTANFSVQASLTPRIVGASQSDAFVKNQNTLVIQKAERFVVASKKEPFIFKVAAKRKKVRK